MSQDPNFGLLAVGASGTTVREGINTAVEAIATQHSGSSAPTVMLPYMEWRQTGSPVTVWRRNGSNDAWLVEEAWRTVAPGVGDDSADGFIQGSRWYDATALRAWECKSAAVGAAVWVELGSGGGGGSLTIYDEAASLGVATTLKFAGGGVTATIDGSTVTATIPSPSAAAGGSNLAVQYNSSGAIAGAGGVSISSPSNTAGYSNHVIEAVNFNYRWSRHEVLAAGTFSPDPAIATMHRVVLFGNATINSANMGAGAELANMQERGVSLLLVNSAGATITITTPTSGAGLWTNAWGADGLATQTFTMAAGARRVVTAAIGKNSDGSVYREFRGG